MIVDRNIGPYSVFIDDSIVDALKKISDNRSGIVFAVTQSGRLEGVMTDGDFRRWLIDQRSIDLNQSVARIVSRNFVAFPQGGPSADLERMFSNKIKIIPIVDDHERLVSVALGSKQDLAIGPFTINETSPAVVIAEIGNNHNGSLDMARRLIDEAKAANADVVKFQMRQLESLYANGGDPNDSREDLGSQYVLDLLSRFSLSNDDMFAAFEHCKNVDILPLCTPWDEASLALLEGYGMAAYKVASADLTNHRLIDAIARTGKPIILSTGMSTEHEILETVRLVRGLGAEFILLHCNSTYPAPLSDIQLRYMDRLKEIGECPVGYSGHERDINVSIAAVTLGAKVIEKHFTLDRDLEGNDHKVSLLPAEFHRMVEGIRQVEQALGQGESRSITQGELMNREVLAKSLVAARAIRAGDIITADKIDVRSPGKGLQPNRLSQLLGSIARRDLAVGDFFFPSDLDEAGVGPRARYTFRRRWGIPVRFHDFRSLLDLTTPDILEFHLSYKDMDEPLEKFFSGPLDFDFVIHCPELFHGDHIIDLSAADDAYRRRSIAEVQRVVDLTRRMTPYFSKASRPLIVTNIGGYTFDAHLAPEARRALYERFAASLQEIESEDVEIIPQTMPPFPWHFGGQRFHNLFVDAESIVTLCREADLRICLDISHSKLACNFLHHSFHQFVSSVGPYAAHMHLADAQGLNGEGLQIGEGEIDFVDFAKLIDEQAPEASFIPEIWQGHKNNGEGFWKALDRLEKAFSPAG